MHNCVREKGKSATCVFLAVKRITFLFFCFFLSPLSDFLSELIKISGRNSMPSSLSNREQNKTKKKKQNKHHKKNILNTHTLCLFSLSLFFSLLSRFFSKKKHSVFIIRKSLFCISRATKRGIRRQRVFRLVFWRNFESTNSIYVRKDDDDDENGCKSSSPDDDGEFDDDRKQRKDDELQ